MRISTSSRFYLIRCLTRLKLRIYFEHALFYRLSHSWQAITCTNRLRQQEIWVRDYRPNIRLSTQMTPGIVTLIACIHPLVVSVEGNTTHTHRHCSSLTRFLPPHQALHNWHAEKKKSFSSLSTLITASLSGDGCPGCLRASTFGQASP